MPHQQAALDYAVSRDVIALFMEMRLGKSLVATRWAISKSPRRVLVLAPNPVVPVWEHELGLEGVEGTILTGTRKQRYEQARSSDGWFLLNFESLTFPRKKDRGGKPIGSVHSPIADLHWDVVIVDESTRIRNPKAAITKTCLTKFESTKCKAILSGYPAPESFLDYFCQMAFLYGTFCGCRNWWTFRKMHMKQIWQHEWIPQKGAIEKIKTRVHQNAFVLTRDKAGIGSKKITESRYLEMTPVQKRMSKEVEKNFEMTLDSGERLETNYAVVQTNWLARICGGVLQNQDIISTRKADELIRLLEGELGDQPVIVWFHYNYELWMVKKMLRARGITCIDMVGGQKPKTRNSRISKWKRGRYRVLLMQSRVGLYGLDLSHSSVSIYYSNYYDGEVREQTEDRIVHPQKKEPLLIIDLITKDSIDETCVEILRRKRVPGKLFMRELLYERYGWDGLTKEGKDDS